MKPKSRVKAPSKSPSRSANHRRHEPSPAQKVIPSVITSRDDLPFTARDADHILIDWQPIRHAPDDHGRRVGYSYAQAVAHIVDVDEYEAYCAIKHALLSPASDPDQPEEHGFVDGIARDAMIGMRAKAAKESLPFSTGFDPKHSTFCSLLEQVDVMKAQFKAMRVKPWRTYAEAGLG